MSKIKVSEKFYSVQGEGQWTGVPSVFLRTFGCNFQCAGFNMPRGQLSTEPDEIAEAINSYKTYDELPLSKTGCDSYAAWHPKFKHLSPSMKVSDLVESMRDLLPNRSWTQPNGQDIHLVITGGEPLLGWQRSYEDLLEQPGMQDLKNLTFETNATQQLTEPFKKYLQSQKRFHVTWSCSPKLGVSGETWSEAIRPEIVVSYRDLVCGNGSSLYLKFVVADSHDMDDVRRAVQEYQQAGVTCPVYLMPVGGTVETYQYNSTQVAQLAMREGFRYSPRLQCDLFGNQWGT